jgi:hypothetical protein
MKHLFRNALVVVMGVALAGCEWGGSGDDNSWNDSSSVANFSGNYTANGGYLVSDYSSSSSGGGSTTVTTPGEENVLNENKGSIPAVSFNGLCSLTPVKAGSFHLFITGGADGQLNDDGSGGLSGSVNIGGGVTVSASGTINYDNGAYGVVCPVSAQNVIGKNVTITYTRLTGSGGSTTTTTGGADPGSSGVTIYAFNVQQSGNKVSIIDNNGSVYSGSLGDVKTTGGLSSSSSGGTPANGDQVIAPFSASGKSKSGMYVNIAGNFQGTVASVSSVSEVSGDTTTIKSSFSLSDRVILGTWIEDGGKTGDIRGRSSSAANVTVSSSTSTNSP